MSTIPERAGRIDGSPLRASPALGRWGDWSLAGGSPHAWQLPLVPGQEG